MMNDENKTIPQKPDISGNGPDADADPVANEATSAPPPASDDDWKAEAEKYKDMCIRAQAEMENTRKRLEREKTEFLKFATESLVKDLLPIVDNLDRALEHAKTNKGEPGGILEGVRLIYDGFMNVLSKYGVSAIDALGQPFDPNLHEAVMQRDDPERPANTVIEVIQRGYTMHGRLIRPAMAVVSRMP
jgi:molecular chaperone GrpE